VNEVGGVPNLQLVNCSYHCQFTIINVCAREKNHVHFTFLLPKVKYMKNICTITKHVSISQLINTPSYSILKFIFNLLLILVTNDLKII